MPRFPQLACALALCGAHIAVGESTATAQPVLRIARSNSSNEVHYVAVLRPDCRLADEPVRAYWIRPAAPARSPRALTWMQEKMLYGVRFSELSEHRAVFTLAADGTRPFILESFRGALACRVRVQARILGEWAEPRQAFVKMVEGGLLPAVVHVDLHALRPDGSAVCERIAALGTAGAPCGRFD